MPLFGGKRRNSSRAELGLLGLAIAFTLYFAADLLVPVAFAILLNILLSPIVDLLERVRIPPAVSAAVLASSLVGVVVLVFSILSEPAEQWMVEAPNALRNVQERSSSAQDSLAGIQQLAEEVDQLTHSDVPDNTQQVVVQGPGVLESVLGGLPAVLTFAGIVVFLTFFLLASGDAMLRRMTRCGRSWGERRRIVIIARLVQSDLSRYLLTVTITNIVLGLIVAFAMHLLDVPNPLLWGAMVAILNFAPYVGAMVSAVILALVGLATFDSPADAMMVPGVYLVLTIIEGQLVTPAVLGQRMSLSPIFVFLSVIVWGWLWGAGGALMAVPIVTAVKVICEQVPGLARISAFVSNGVPGHPLPNGERLAQARRLSRRTPARS